MLGTEGNPRPDKLFAVVGYLRKQEGVTSMLALRQVMFGMRNAEKRPLRDRCFSALQLKSTMIYRPLP